MVVRIRLARFGKKKAPFYNIVVMPARTGRQRLPIEVVGTYNPIPDIPPPNERIPGEKGVKEIAMDVARIKYWLGVGAQPSDTVARLLAKAQILPSKPHHAKEEKLAADD